MCVNLILLLIVVMSGCVRDRDHRVVPMVSPCSYLSSHPGYNKKDEPVSRMRWGLNEQDTQRSEVSTLEHKSMRL